MKRDGENKVPPTARQGAMEGVGEPAARRELHGAGDGIRARDLELGKIRAVDAHVLSTRPLGRASLYDASCSCGRWSHNGVRLATAIREHTEHVRPPPAEPCYCTGEPHAPHSLYRQPTPAESEHWRTSDLINARNRASAELQAREREVALAASVYIGPNPPGRYEVARAELERAVEAFRRATIAHSKALRAFEDAR